ncbi:hypothetical protein POV27_10765 [Aureisphaera galaxeae]|uniref:hypothetical protein n=1 Tax=Aureisphaera galaxeae TaxID=1538023 RepID=UPI002350D3BB|nr:hypothetical protein [Aureisphaera galaxeae]MDC8004530.1 hypothetical protein [Aureisphaera galaxeae]
MKKIVLPLTMFFLVLSCTVENDPISNQNSSNLSYHLSEDSNLGAYKGVFTTYNSKYRGVITVQLPNNPSNRKVKYPMATLRLNSGESYLIKANQYVDDHAMVQDLLFESAEVSFLFSVEANGAEPTITDVTFKGLQGDMIVLKDTERAPVTPITGTYECGTCNGHPVLGTGLEQSFNFVFSSSDSNGTIATQSAIGTTVYSGIGVQNNCYDTGTIGNCNVQSGNGTTTNTGYIVNGNPVTWIASHLYNNEPTGLSDCSYMQGTWRWQSISYGVINGTFTSDSFCNSIMVYEDFEDDMLSYTPNPVDNVTNVSSQDYFGILLPEDGVPGTINYSAVKGNGYYGAQDTDATSSGNVDRIEMNWDNLSIAPFSIIDVSAFFAEDDASDGNQDWDADSSVRIEYSFDNVNWTSLIAFESEIGMDGNQTNEVPRLDADHDGIGDDAILTDTLVEYKSTFPTAGNPTVSIRLVIENLDSEDEDIAIDNILIQGN